MCGIAGIYRRDGACDIPSLVRMRDILAHRGPDDRGLFVDGPVGLVHRRLSIIDLSGGHQPMHTPDGRFTIVFNGEIYNYRELKRALEAVGAVFTSSSDTEVILQLHATYGDDAVKKLNGMFAYALWDGLERRLLLVRDRAGIKPLHWSQAAEGVAFGSEIKALFSSGLVQPAVNEGGIGEYLAFRCVAGTDSLYEGVHSVAPGSFVEIREGRAHTVHRYWTARASPGTFSGGYEEAVRRLDDALDKAVQRQMISDVPLGTFCSGGVDSSLVTALAAKHCPSGLNTFSVAFAESGWDESRFAKLVSDRFGTVHHEIVVSEGRFIGLLPDLIWGHDQPLHFANSVHIFAVSELARRYVTVVLTGEGADELFGGYPRYTLPLISGMAADLPAWSRQALSRVASALPGHRWSKAGVAIGSTLEEALTFNAVAVPPAVLARELDLHVPKCKGFRKSLLQAVLLRESDPIEAAMAVDFETYLVALLERQDRMSMAASLESRVPFLDNEIIDLAQSVPRPFKRTIRHRKRMLCDVALRHLPEQVVKRAKSGFGVPLQLWFAGAGPAGAMLDRAARSRWVSECGWANDFRRLIDEHRRGRADHSEILWTLLNLAVWYDVQFDGRSWVDELNNSLTSDA